MKKRSAVAGFAAVAVFATAVYAATTFDPDSGFGFVGKGEVQEIYGWNNKALQDNEANVEFRAKSETVEERSWTCTNINDDSEQMRERKRTTKIEGILSATGRERRQITGFILNGYDGDPKTINTPESGQILNSCPGGPSWSLTTPAGDWYVVSSTNVLEVSFDGGDWLVIE
jgi:hypothetical protein